MLAADALPLCSNLCIFIRSDTCICLNVLGRTVKLDGQLVSVNEDARAGFEEAVNIFQGAVRGFGVEEVGNGYESEANDCPDDPKLVT